ncbi:hypothetical protein [Staphylococcus gallinarum]|uniref:hypothetical protein n=1 Tax=Staphylococcus gallinarum TaxID=1293 RepID=UPI001E541A3C|nr:hypothetical protein [Staphylococcus gallinarum]MCD8845160.1 hypothetical protein [Staphylococcus gallinarum]
MKKITSNIYIQLGFILVGIILLALAARIEEINMVSVILAVFAMIFFAFGINFLILGVNYKDKQNYIQRINIEMQQLNYTEYEIKERQNYLNNISLQKLKEIDYTLQQEIKHIDDNNFYSPIKKNIK